MMVGRSVNFKVDKEDREPGDVILDIRNMPSLRLSSRGTVRISFASKRFVQRFLIASKRRGKMAGARNSDVKGGNRGNPPAFHDKRKPPEISRRFPYEE